LVASLALPVEHQFEIVDRLKQKSPRQFAKPAIDRLPSPEVDRQHPPPASRTDQVANRVDYLPEIDLPRAASPCVPRPRGDEPSEQPGLILQNPAPTCASYSPTATQSFGPSHRWKIIYAKGAKGLESFGSGKFTGEREVTMLPNHRFMIIEHKPKGPEGFAETTVLLLPPDPELDSDYWS
jgi:hypothetical protein